MSATLILALAPLLQDPFPASARFEPTSAPIGAEVELRVTLTLDEGWHVYHPEQDPLTGVPVSVAVPEGFVAAGPLRSLAEPDLHVEEIGGETLEYLWLSGEVELVLPLTVAGAAGEREVEVTVGYQACTEEVCLAPESVGAATGFEATPGDEDTAAPTAAQAPPGRESGGIPGLLPFGTPAQEAGGAGGKKVEIEARLEPGSAAVGSEVELQVTLSIIEGWHVYHPDQNPEFGIPVSVAIPEGFAAAGDLVVDQEPETHVEDIAGVEYTYLWLSNTVRMTRTLRVLGEVGKAEVPVTVRYQACDDSTCDLPTTGTATTSFERLPGVAPAAGISDVERSTARKALDKGLLAFLLLAVGAALASLATPCVFPMIPITVSYFSKRAEQGKGTALGNAGAYGMGIVATFVGLGLLVTALFGAGGINSLASNPYLNLALAGLFLVFGISLIGFFEIKPPQWLQNRMSAASASGQQKGGYGPVIVMAGAFSLISFTCTVGFVGAVLAFAAQGEWFYAALGMTVFAVVFAAPFFFLALFPSALQKMPKAGGWMNAIKVSLGFVELVFALKFLSNADMFWDLEILTRPVVIVLTVVPLALTALYLFGVIKAPHEVQRVKPGMARAGFGVLFAVFAVWVGLGLRGGPYQGPIEAFFPPEHYGGDLHPEEELVGSRVSGPAGLIWYENFEEAFAAAREEGRRLFLDFTGVTCVNCRRMEGNIMPTDAVKPLLEQFVRAELWVDKPPHGDWNKQYQIDRFGTSQQPLYVVIDPTDDRVVATFDGYKPDPELFARFLREGLEG